MKQDIVCTTCSEWWEKLETVPEEHVRLHKGMALNHYNCDRCNAEIVKGSPCVAVSVWHDRVGIPYYEWYEDFIVTEAALNTKHSGMCGQCGKQLPAHFESCPLHIERICISCRKSYKPVLVVDGDTCPSCARY